MLAKVICQLRILVNLVFKPIVKLYRNSPVSVRLGKNCILSLKVRAFEKLCVRTSPSRSSPEVWFGALVKYSWFNPGPTLRSKVVFSLLTACNPRPPAGATRSLNCWNGLCSRSSCPKANHLALAPRLKSIRPPPPMRLAVVMVGLVLLVLVQPELGTLQLALE